MIAYLFQNARVWSQLSAEQLTMLEELDSMYKRCVSESTPCKEFQFKPGKEPREPLLTNAEATQELRDALTLPQSWSYITPHVKDIHDSIKMYLLRQSEELGATITFRARDVRRLFCIAAAKYARELLSSPADVVLATCGKWKAFLEQVAYTRSGLVDPPTTARNDGFSALVTDLKDKSANIIRLATIRVAEQTISDVIEKIIHSGRMLVDTLLYLTPRILWEGHVPVVSVYSFHERPLPPGAADWTGLLPNILFTISSTQAAQQLFGIKTPVFYRSRAVETTAGEVQTLFEKCSVTDSLVAKASTDRFMSGSTLTKVTRENYIQRALKLCGILFAMMHVLQCLQEARFITAFAGEINVANNSSATTILTFLSNSLRTCIVDASSTLKSCHVDLSSLRTTLDSGMSAKEGFSHTHDEFRKRYDLFAEQYATVDANVKALNDKLTKEYAERRELETKKRLAMLVNRSSMVASTIPWLLPGSGAAAAMLTSASDRSGYDRGALQQLRVSQKRRATLLPSSVTSRTTFASSFIISSANEPTQIFAIGVSAEYLAVSMSVERHQSASCIVIYDASTGLSVRKISVNHTLVTRLYWLSNISQNFSNTTDRLLLGLSERDVFVWHAHPNEHATCLHLTSAMVTVTEGNDVFVAVADRQPQPPLLLVPSTMTLQPVGPTCICQENVTIAFDVNVNYDAVITVDRGAQNASTSSGDQLSLWDIDRGDFEPDRVRLPVSIIEAKFFNQGKSVVVLQSNREVCLFCPTRGLQPTQRINFDGLLPAPSVNDVSRSFVVARETSGDVLLIFATSREEGSQPRVRAVFSIKPDLTTTNAMPIFQKKSLFSFTNEEVVTSVSAAQGLTLQAVVSTVASQLLISLKAL